MATIPGSHYVATAPGQPVNVVETMTGMGLPPPMPGAFNLEVFVGGAASSNVVLGYQGLAVLSPSGNQLDLVAGGFAVTDNGSGNDTIDARGVRETIVGGASGGTLNLFGSLEEAHGGSGPDTINVFGGSDLVIGGSGSDTINVFASTSTLPGGSGGDVITGGSGTDLINVFGSSSHINQGTGSDTINVFGSSDTVTAGVAVGANQGTVNVFGSGTTLADGGNKFADTVVGFDQSAGDRIHLTTDTVADAVAHSTQVHGGADTMITLSDGSTILLKGVSHIDPSFFS